MIGSLCSGHVDAEDDTVKIPHTVLFKKYIREVMKQCSMSRDFKQPVLKWGKVCEKLQEKDALCKRTLKIGRKKNFFLPIFNVILHKHS